MKVRQWILAFTAILAVSVGAKPLASFGPEKLKAAQGPGQTLVLAIDKPAIIGAHYALKGQVTYDGVEGDGYLELLNYFDGNQVYFTRSKAASGPMGVLHGSSKGRAFELPFDATGPDGKTMHPTRLELKVVLPKGGKVRVDSVDLVELADKTGAETLPQRGVATR